MWADYKRRQQNTPRHEPPPSPGQAPDVYVAETPEGGIPARDGTTLGSAVCSVYKVVGGELVAVTLASGPYQITVHNIWKEAITAEYVTISREKYGIWVADPSTEDGTGTGTGTECVDNINGTPFGDLEAYDGDGSDIAYILGIDDSGCLVRIPTGLCDTTGTGS